MKPVSASKTSKSPLILTPRDEEILRAVYAYRYMTAKDISHLLFSPSSLTYARERLSALSGGKDNQERQYLFRFQRPTAKTGSRDRVYTLGSLGRDLLASLGLPVDWYFRPYKAERLSHSHLAHSLLLTRFVVAAHYWSSKQPYYDMIQSRLSYDLARDTALVSTGEDKKTATPLVLPDAWLYFERLPDGARFPILLEVDRGTEYQTKFKQHVRDRLAFIRSGDYARLFGTPAVIIAYATTGQIAEYRETRRKTIAAWTSEVLTELNLQSWSTIFRITSLVFDTLYDDAQALFEQPVWYRPDSPTAPVPLLTP